MEKFYLSDFKWDSDTRRILSFWNGGCSLKEAVKKSKEWYDIDTNEVIKMWRKLYRTWGYSSVPICKIKPITGPDWYLEWHGVIGEGKKIKDILLRIKNTGERTNG